MSGQKCFSQSALSNYLLGKGSQQACQTVEDHLTQCNRCRHQLAALRNSDDELSSTLPLQSALDSVPEAFLNDPDYQQGFRSTLHLGQSTVPTAGELSPPSRIPSEPQGKLGQYQLLEIIGEGGMGRVYRAFHTSLEKEVALKTLHVNKAGDSSAIDRFRREMKAIGKLSHPNVVLALDAGEIDEIHYLAMELIQGVDLARVIASLGRLPIAEACEIVCQTAAGLQQVHEHGLVHRDLKPSNLILTNQGQVKILDLGLSRIVEPWQLTKTNQVMGTPDYMAPEQWESSHDVDIRADLYSLGCALYHLLTGKPPYSGASYNSLPAKMRGHQEHAPPQIRRLLDNVPERLSAILDRLLEKDRNRRFATPEDLRIALLPFAKGSDLSRLLRKPGPNKGASSGTAPESGKSSVVRRDSDQGLKGKAQSTSPSVSVEDASPSFDWRAILRRKSVQLGALGSILLGVLTWAAVTWIFTGKSSGPDPKGPATVTQDPLVLSWHGFLVRERDNHWEEHTLRENMVMYAGDGFRIVLRAGEGCFVYIINVDARDTVSVLFPHERIGLGNRCQPNTDYTIPDGDQWIELDDNTGSETLYLIASREPLPQLEKLLKTTGGTANSRTSQQLASLIRPLEQQAAQIKTRGMKITTDKRLAKAYHKPSNRMLTQEMANLVGTDYVVRRLTFQHKASSPTP